MKNCLKTAISNEPIYCYIPTLEFNLRITQHTDFNTINALAGTKMSNTHYCDYKIKYRSKLEILATPLV